MVSGERPNGEDHHPNADVKRTRHPIPTESERCKDKRCTDDDLNDSMRLEWNDSSFTRGKPRNQGEEQMNNREEVRQCGGETAKAEHRRCESKPDHGYEIEYAMKLRLDWTHMLH